MDQELKELLLSMQSEIRGISSRMDAVEDDMRMVKDDMRMVKDDMRTVKDGMRTVKDDLQSVKADVAQIPDMRRDINLILESQQGINDKFQKLDRVAEDVEEIKSKVNALEEVTRSNTSQIREFNSYYNPCCSINLS